MASFGDLCLPFQQDARVMIKYISFLANLGYETIAVERTVTPEIKAKKQQQQGEKIPFPPDLSKLPELETLKKAYPRLKLLTRITVVINENSQLRFLSGEAVQSYDIVSVRPATEKLFQQIAQTAETDLISFELNSRMGFYIKVPQVKLAVERGISFEITYAPTIRDETLRKNVIANALELIRVCKGKNIVMSSRAERIMELRGPYDVVNLGLLFGLKQDLSKAAVSRNVRSVIYHAEARNQTAKAAFAFTKLPGGVKRGHDDGEASETACSSKKIKTSIDAGSSKSEL